MTGIHINVSIVETGGEFTISTTITHFCTSTLSDASMKYLNMRLETQAIVDKRGAEDDLDMSESSTSDAATIVSIESKRYASSIFDRELPNIVELVKHLQRVDPYFSFSGEISKASVCMTVKFSATLITPVAVAPHVQMDDPTSKLIKGIIFII